MLDWELLAATELLDPPVTAIWVTVKEELPSASVSSAINNSDPELTAFALFSLTASVSLTATGSSLIPVTVITNVAVSVSPCPSVTV